LIIILEVVSISKKEMNSMKHLLLSIWFKEARFDLGNEFESSKKDITFY
jgi:hypothetical protein